MPQGLCPSARPPVRSRDGRNGAPGRDRVCDARLTRRTHPAGAGARWAPRKGRQSGFRASGRGPPQLQAQPFERVQGRAVADMVGVVGAEEGVAAGWHAGVLLAAGGVVAQRRDRGGVQGHQSGPTAFAGSHGEHTIGEVNVGAGQREGFGDAQAGAGK